MSNSEAAATDGPVEPLDPRYRFPIAVATTMGTRNS
jgi:hypothetical protein